MEVSGRSGSQRASRLCWLVYKTESLFMPCTEMLSKVLCVVVLPAESVDRYCTLTPSATVLPWRQTVSGWQLTNKPINGKSNRRRYVWIEFLIMTCKGTTKKRNTQIGAMHNAFYTKTFKNVSENLPKTSTIRGMIAMSI